jgi:hypothetical protein
VKRFKYIFTWREIRRRVCVALAPKKLLSRNNKVTILNKLYIDEYNVSLLEFVKRLIQLPDVGNAFESGTCLYVRRTHE